MRRFKNFNEKAYDKNDVRNVQKLEKQLQAVLKDVDKTMRGSGLSAPAFAMVRGGVRKSLEAIEKFYKIAKSSKESISEALGNDNPSHREKPKMDKDGTVHNIPGKKGGLSAYSIKPRLDGKTLKFGTVDNEGNIKVMTVQELAKVLK